MTPAEILSPELTEKVDALRAAEKPFAFATIVRTIGSTAAKPGAKALLAEDGTILDGWLGGACARGAVKRAALEAFRTAEPQLISVTPEEFLAELGVKAGTRHSGVTYAQNGCPSKGTVDIFIEPSLPLPELIVIGGSPVAKALCLLAAQFQFESRLVDADADLLTSSRQRYVVIATQGQGDMAALNTALTCDPSSISFVGSSRKFAALSQKLLDTGADPLAVRSVKAPAGLNINAVTPDEIALSIMAELVKKRRIARAEF